MTIADRLHVRLKALGYDVYHPKRIWLGRGYRNGDWWRWQAGEKISNGLSHVGCNLSMAECLKMPDDELLQRIESDN